MTAEKMKVKDSMIDKARRLWPYSISFDFVKCCNCDFVGLVKLGDDDCPTCGEPCLQWADENQQEYSL